MTEIGQAETEVDDFLDLILTESEGLNAEESINLLQSFRTLLLCERPDFDLTKV